MSRNERKYTFGHVHNEESDQLSHPRSLINFLSALRRLDAQADLSLRLAYVSEDTVCHIGD